MCLSFHVQIDPVDILSRAWKALKRPIGYLKNTKSKITRLNNAMGELRSQKGDLNERVRLAELAGETLTHQVRDWLAKVVVVDAKVSKIIIDHKNGSFLWCINRRAEKCHTEIAAMRSEAAAFEVEAVKLAPDGLQEVPTKHPINLNMGSYLTRLQAYLHDDGSRIIGIWGMSGVGKTTLLKSLNNKLLSSSQSGETPRQFDHVIWVVASKKDMLAQLQHDIAQRLGLPLHEDEDRQAREIYYFLKSKSFLLLLDDLWHPVDFYKVGIPHSHRVGVSAHVKQKVVLTTQLEWVCSRMQSEPTMKMECLEDAKAWQLFQNQLGTETLGAHARIPELAPQVAKECGGLPLALVMIGKAMRRKEDPEVWQNALTMLQKSRYQIHGMDDSILPKLKLSYDNLPNENLRKCFILCCLWPEGCSISNTDLIECWMGHKLFDERKYNNINEVYYHGYDFINVLLSACLLERDHDEMKEVKMHDVVRDLGLWIASNCGKEPNKIIVNSNTMAFYSMAFKDTQEEVERISLFHSNVRDTSDLPVNCSKMETLILHKSISFKSIRTGFFDGAPALTYLDLSYTAIDDVSSEIGLLNNLCYLNLSHTNITSLPWQLGYLHKLRFLFLQYLESIVIPEGLIEKLVMLSVIDMTNTQCDNWKELSRLRGCLKGVGISLETIEELQQLAQLPNIPTWRLVLRKLVGFNEPLQLLSPTHLGSPSIRSNIQMLKIEFCESLEVVSLENNGNHGGNSQKWYLDTLKEVELRSLPNLKEIVWEGVVPANMMRSLIVLNISGCDKLSNITWVMRLPSLQELTVHDCAGMKQVIHEDRQQGNGEEENDVVGDDHAFQSLRKLCLRELRSLKKFANVPLAFPSLKDLKVAQCPKLKDLPLAFPSFSNSDKNYIKFKIFTFT